MFGDFFGGGGYNLTVKAPPQTITQILNDGVFDTEPWQSYSPTKAWTLPAGDGVKTVYVRYRDASHYTSDTFSDSIILDTTPPAITAVTASPAMVAQGDPLGFVGSTGLSTGAHLHWEMASQGILLDALRFTDGTNGF